MAVRDLPSRPNLEQYRKQATELLTHWRASDSKTTRKLADAQHAIARDHGFDTWKQFTNEIARRTGLEERSAIWKSAEDALVAGDDATLARLLCKHETMFRTEQPRSSWCGGLTPDYRDGDARTIIARDHFFESWEQFAEFARKVKDASSPVARFERAVDAVVSGDAASLERALRDYPELVRARSTRTHHSTLLHYVGANGVEGWRQRTPKNAVQILEILLAAGAEIDATADMYNGGCTTLGLVATSGHPRDAGLQQPLIDVLLAHGARIDALGGGNWSGIVNSCLANGRAEAAEYLAKRGAPLDLEGAAGVGRLDLVKSFLQRGRQPETAGDRRAAQGRLHVGVRVRPDRRRRVPARSRRQRQRRAATSAQANRPALGHVRRPRGHSESAVEAPTKARRERRVFQRNAAWLGSPWMVGTAARGLSTTGTLWLTRDDRGTANDAERGCSRSRPRALAEEATTAMNHARCFSIWRGRL